MDYDDIPATMTRLDGDGVSLHDIVRREHEAARSAYRRCKEAAAKFDLLPPVPHPHLIKDAAGRPFHLILANVDDRGMAFVVQYLCDDDVVPLDDFDDEIGFIRAVRQIPALVDHIVAAKAALAREISRSDAEQHTPPPLKTPVPDEAETAAAEAKSAQKPPPKTDTSVFGDQTAIYLHPERFVEPPGPDRSYRKAKMLDPAPGARPDGPPDAPREPPGKDADKKAGA